MKTSLLQKSERVRVGFLCVFLLNLASNVDGAGYVVAWGDNSYEQISVPGGLTNIVGVAAGIESSLALTADGRVIAWGASSYGITTPPTTVTNVVRISAYYYHALALRGDGIVVDWGSNLNGQSHPAPPWLSNVTAVSAGGWHRLALRADGSVVAWGNYSGNATNTAGLSNIVAIAAGNGVSVAVRSNGNLAILGSGVGGESLMPASASNVTEVAASDGQVVVVRADGRVVAWGNNQYGRTNVPSDLTNVLSVAAGRTHNLALRQDRTLAAWGDNSYEQIRIPPGLTNVLAIAAGNHHSLAVVGRNDGSPVVIRHPHSWQVDSGSTVTFVAAAEGNPAPSYQWQLNGGNLAGATNPVLVVTNVQIVDAGDYQLIASNTEGVASSLTAELRVTNLSPVLLTPPMSTHVFLQGTGSFAVAAAGSLPLSYQWRFNGLKIGDATNALLTLSNVTLSDEGTYDVLVTNPVGSTNSSAFLNVVSLGEALNTNLVWETVGNAPWFTVNGWPNNDYFVPAARSGRITNGQSSSIQTTVTGPGALRFSWMVSCQPLVDYAAFTINGEERARISGNAANDFTDWTVTDPPFYLGPGTYELRWAFHKTSSGSSGNSGWLEGDTAWLTRVTYTNAATPPVITTQPASKVVWSGSNVTFLCNVQSTPPLSYQWQFNGTKIVGATASTLTLTNVQPSQRGGYRVLVSNVYGSILSSNATLFVDYVGPNDITDPLDRWWLRDLRVFNKVEYAGGRFFALGGNGSLATSEDGITWESRVTGVTSSLRGVAYGPEISRYVVVGAAATILRSADGTNWVKTVTTNTCDLNDIEWSGMAFVAVATRTQTNQPNALRSSNALNWTSVTFPVGLGGNAPGFSSAVAFGGGVFIAAAGYDYIEDLFRSANGTTWSYVAYSGQLVGGITYGNGRFFLAGMEGSPMVSINSGLNWFHVGDSLICDPPYGYPWCLAADDVTFGNGTFAVAGGMRRSGYSLLTSTNSSNWVPRAAPGSVHFSSVTYGRGTFVAIGNAGIFQSDNVANPILSIRPLVGTPDLVLNSSGEVGRGYRLQSSTNLSTWTDVALFTNALPVTQVVITPDHSIPAKLFRVISP